MLKSLKDKLTLKNKIVEYFQQGKLSEKEFYRLMDEQRADRLQDEQEIISEKEVEWDFERKQRQERQEFEGSVL